MHSPYHGSRLTDSRVHAVPAKVIHTETPLNWNDHLSQVQVRFY